MRRKKGLRISPSRERREAGPGRVVTAGTRVLSSPRRASRAALLPPAATETGVTSVLRALLRGALHLPSRGPTQPREADTVPRFTDEEAEAQRGGSPTHGRPASAQQSCDLNRVRGTPLLSPAGDKWIAELGWLCRQVGHLEERLAGRWSLCSLRETASATGWRADSGQLGLGRGRDQASEGL